jgi:hypothetical protein
MASQQQQQQQHHHQQQQQLSNMDEETTTFRSVPRAPTGMAMSALPSMPGLVPLGAPKLQQALALRVPSSSSSKPPTTAERTSLPPQVLLSWKVDAATIPAVPDDYPLERTHMTCDSSLTCDQITERIARVLQAQNLHCLFHSNSNDDDDDDEEILPGRVDCSSKDSDLKFVVQLWRAQQQQQNQQIVVEVQRRRGDAMEFSAIRKPLFRTLLSNNNAAAAVERKRFSPPPFVPNQTFRVLPPSMVSMGRSA